MNIINLPAMDKITFVSLLALGFVLPIVHSTSIKHFLEILLLIAFIVNIKKINFNYLFSDKAIVILLIISTWIIINNLFFSFDSNYSWKEFNSQWLRPIFIFFICLSLSQNKNREFFFYAFLIGMGIHIVIHLFDALFLWFNTQNFPFQITRLTGNRTNLSYTINIFSGFILSLFFYRFYQHGFSFKGVAIISIFLLIIFFTSIQIGTRNGLIGLFMTVFSLSMIAFVKIKSLTWVKKLFALLIFLIFFSSLLLVILKSDNRWSSFFQTVKFAMNIELKEKWSPIDSPIYPYFAMENGQMPEGSAYERTLMAREALVAIRDFPWGVGFGRGAWGMAVSETLKVNRSGHSHSGILDWTVSLGWIGLFLWLLFITYLIYISVASWLRNNSPYSMFLALLVSGFFIRSLVDSNIRDFSFEMFILAVGLVLNLARTAPINKN